MISAPSGVLVLEEAGALAACLAVVGTFLLRSSRGRALAFLVALAVAPLLVVVELRDTPQLLALREAPLVAAAALALALGTAAALAVLFLRCPRAVAVAAVLTVPFRVPIAAGGDSANLLVPLYLVVGAGGLAYAWARLRRGPLPGEGRPGRLELALLAALVLYAVQAAYTTDFAQALENLAFFYLPFALLVRLLGGIEWTARLLRTCLGVAVALAVAFVAVGFVEYATRTLLLNPKVIASNQFESFFRVNSLFFDPNIYGRFLVMVMLAVSAAMLWAAERRTMLAAGGVLALLWAGLLLTFSQSSFTALLVGLAVLAALRWGARRVLVGGVAAVVAAALFVVLGQGLLRVELGSARSVDRATSGRFDLMGGGLALWVERPVFGHGSGSFSERFTDREDASPQTAVAASHTIPITVAAEQGLVGLAAYLGVLGAAAGLLGAGLGALRGRAPPTQELVARAALAACFAGLVVHTLLYAAFLEDPITWTLLGAALGLRGCGGAIGEAPARPRRAEPPAAAARTRTGSSSR
jgi:O-antigen ligase